MKSLFNTTVLFAGALVLGSLAYGQDSMKATVPFPFQTALASLPAGTYDLNVVNYASGTRMVTLRNVDTKKTIIAVGHVTYANFNQEAKPRMTFRCSSGNCSLSEIWTSSVGFQYNAPHRKGSAGDRVASVPITVTKGE